VDSSLSRRGKDNDLQDSKNAVASDLMQAAGLDPVHLTITSFNLLGVRLMDTMILENE